MERRFNLTEAAKKLGVTRQSLYYWIKKKWVSPKRDYRGYPVFTEKELNKIKRWKEQLTD